MKFSLVSKGVPKMYNYNECMINDFDINLTTYSYNLILAKHSHSLLFFYHPYFQQKNLQGSRISLWTLLPQTSLLFFMHFLSHNVLELRLLISQPIFSLVLTLFSTCTSSSESSIFIRREDMKNALRNCKVWFSMNS